MATNFAKATYQEIIDLHTEAGKVSVIGIHTPQGAKPRKMLEGFFKQFRKYKYDGCSLTIVPVAKLPADPLQVSYKAGEVGIDPRDIVNPLLFHGCHGDNLNQALNSIYKGTFDFTSESVDLSQNDANQAIADADWEAMYYRAMQDPTFMKSHIMKPFRKKGLHPLVYNVASNHQILPNEGNGGAGSLIPDGGDYVTFGFAPALQGTVENGKGGAVTTVPRFMTNRLQSLGWMDTRQVINSKTTSAENPTVPADTVLPKIFMGMLLLPPCYKQEMYMRMVLVHRFSFKEFNTSLSLPGATAYHDFNEGLSGSKDKSISLDTINSSAEITTDGVY